MTAEQQDSVELRLNSHTVAVQGPVGYVAVPVSTTEDIKVRSDQYVDIVGEKVTSVDRRRRRSSAGVTLRRRSVAAIDRDRRPVSYRDRERPQPADFVTQNGCRRIGDSPDHVKGI